jgi:hypothetical protein
MSANRGRESQGPGAAAIATFFVFRPMIARFAMLALVRSSV